MTVKGLGNAGVPAPDPRHLNGAAGGKRASAVGATDGTRGAGRTETSADADVLELSVDAINGQRATGVPPRGTLSAARVQQISARIADGSYDRPEVQDAVLDRLAPHLDTLGESAG